MLIGSPVNPSWETGSTRPLFSGKVSQVNKNLNLTNNYTKGSRSQEGGGAFMIMDYKTRGNNKHCNVSGELHQRLPPLHYCKLQLHVCVPADCSAPRSFQAHMDLCVVASLSRWSAM